MKFIKVFEKFHKDKVDSMINNQETYLKSKKEIDENQDNNDLTNRSIDIVNAIKNYDYSKFIIKIDNNSIVYKPNIDFIKLFTLLDKPNMVEFDEPRYLFIDKPNNIIEFDHGIPKQLRGFGIGYKFYKIAINEFKFITSKKGMTYKAYNLWYKLMQDDDYYCFTSKENSGVVLKNASDEIIIEFLDISKKFDNVIYDDELKTKIEELYGSFKKFIDGK